MHLPPRTAGISSESGSSGFFLTILMACEGQCLAQLPQLTSSVFTIQRSRLTTARPICMEDFSSTLTGRMAPAGQMSEQLVHSGRHHPLSYDISGCIRFINDVDGLSTLFGHTLTHSWQAVHLSVKFFMPRAPAGTRGVLRRGLSAYDTSAYPPSVFISWALAATAVPAITADARNALLPWSLGLLSFCIPHDSTSVRDTSLSTPVRDASRRGNFPYLHSNLIAPSLHVSMQSMHATHLL